LTLENKTSASVRLNIMVFCPDDDEGGQSLAGVDLDFDDDPF
jgi:hypothetical protein